MIPATASAPITCAHARAPSGTIGTASRRKPYVPSFSSTPASSTLPAVGASVWASGSHVWNGKNGTLIAKPANRARNSSDCSKLLSPPSWLRAMLESLARSKSTSGEPVIWAARTARYSRPAKVNTLPAKV